MQRASCGATVAGKHSSLRDTGTKRPEVARGIISATAAAQSQRERDDRQTSTTTYRIATSSIGSAGLDEESSRRFDRFSIVARQLVDHQYD
uniref:Polyketide synthase n=1 Tax=Peronospora matthiolae TaxID=2874970 RepID=A0AAV1TLC3_9STRA